MFRQSLRMTARDWRAGELRFLLLSLIVAVSALSAVGFFIDRMRAGLERDAHQLLGADLLVNADEPIQPAWRAEAQRRGLLLADTVTFPSMAQAGEGEASQAVLASVKAVSTGYPLRGTVRVTTDTAQALDARGTGTNAIPARGTVWIDAALLDKLNTNVGARLQMGDSSFTIAQLIAAEPDRGPSFANFAPRVMLALDDLAATGLTVNGARATFRLQVAAPNANDHSQVDAYEAWLKAQLDKGNVKGVRIESLENGRPEMRSTLDRAGRFLSLVGLLSAMHAEPGRRDVPARIRPGRPGWQRAGRGSRLCRALRAAGTGR
jgi:putative ABC transport system permease protein